MTESAFQGTLFSVDFLSDSIIQLPEWQRLDQSLVAAFERDLLAIYSRFPTSQTPNESQTEDDLIWPVLSRLGWTDTLRQQNLAPRGRDDVPDGLLYGDATAKARAVSFSEEWRRYEHGLAIVESKRWLRPIDRLSGRRGEETAPSTQMLRYLRRVDDLTTGSLRWGILTNGARWRLYYQGAQSVSEQFLEINLPALIALPGHDGGLFSLSADERIHWLKVFILVFGRDSFLPSPSDERTFHQRAIAESRFYEERVANSISKLVFGTVFPQLAEAIADADPSASLQEVREASLILLYRLLFILYAEDRDLLPVRDTRYDDYGLRDKVRGDVSRRKDAKDTFSATAARYWSVLDDLCRAINIGDPSIGLPPYNGGLFSAEKTPLLARVRLGDAVMADVIDALSFEQTADGRKYINYRDLSVQQLGSIYERLLEHEVRLEEGRIVVRPNAFARRGSGSYYTPDELVGLVIAETLGPLAKAKLVAFETRALELQGAEGAEDRRLGTLSQLDPAERMLDLKVCDPAMGSGHFLVSLVDYLSDQVIAAMADARAAVPWADYVSPLVARIAAIRNTILANADGRGWTIDPGQLDDRHIVRRMVLKRCIYGIDKNPMAVELAKVSLWLHTFTVGAPLSFLDHHLKCGDSLFGSWVRDGIDRAGTWGAPLLLHGPMARATRAASPMQIIETLTDAEIAEAHRSADIYAEVQEWTKPLDDFLSLIHALDWLDVKSREEKAALHAFFDGQFGDPVQIASGKAAVSTGRAESAVFSTILERARTLITEERFLNWQVAFPGVWTDWEADHLSGGFDAVIGNPPWDRIKLQQVEWFAARKPEISLAQRASDRDRLIAALDPSSDPIAKDFQLANERAEASFRMARGTGDYPLLSGGDINLYSLFVERSSQIVKPGGVVGLLTPSGIASDKTAASFFKSISTTGRLIALLDFENRRTRFAKEPFFPDVDSRFKFCILCFGTTPSQMPAKCAFFLQDPSELTDPERCFDLSAEDFARVNPNTGTAPIFKSRRDAQLTTSIYQRLPVLVNRAQGEESRAWPVRYATMFHMTNDSKQFRTRRELQEEDGAYNVGGNRFRGPDGEWVPLYEGKMVQAFDHRAASVVVNPLNQHRPAQPEPATVEQHRDPAWLPAPQFWVPLSECGWGPGDDWVLGFKEITAATNARTFIASLFPTVGFGNKIPLLKRQTADRNEWLLAANFNSVIFDFVVRQKIQGQTLNLFIVEQLPVVPEETYTRIHFGSRTALDIVKTAVAELTYTSNDMMPFARDMGMVDGDGNVSAPFEWDEDRRAVLLAKINALYFHLYGITDRDDVRHVFSTFPIIEGQETAELGSYRSLELCLAWMNALAAGDPDANIEAGI